jgi:hypothetical protein
MLTKVVARFLDPQRTCARCGQPLRVVQREDAAFEDIACKNAWQKARRACRQPALLELERVLRDADAAWYRLAIHVDGAGSFVYPPQNKPFPRFDHLRRATWGFRLHPYEPPSVPIGGDYGLILLDGAGQKLPRLPGVYTVYVEPIKRRVPVPVQSGDRWQE